MCVAMWKSKNPKANPGGRNSVYLEKPQGAGKSTQARQSASECGQTSLSAHSHEVSMCLGFCICGMRRLDQRRGLNPLLFSGDEIHGSSPRKVPRPSIVCVTLHHTTACAEPCTWPTGTPGEEVLHWSLSGSCQHLN